MLLDLLKEKAVSLDLVPSNETITVDKAFYLVRDMPYQRASDREPATIIQEWQGTCSGKHYLLKALFAELGYSSQLIACTSVEQIDHQLVPGKLGAVLQAANGRLVDVHNYLILNLPDGEMIVDATWPMTLRDIPLFVVNETFTLGENQKIAANPIETWVVPEKGDPQAFKEKLLQENFTKAELHHRDEIIVTLSQMMNNQ